MLWVLWYNQYIRREAFFFVHECYGGTNRRGMRKSTMAETKIEGAKLLLQDPYRAVLLQDYNKTQEERRFRKRLEEIDNEISWFNGKKNQYKVEDRQGFFKHFQENYAGKKYAPMGPLYRPLTSFKFGEEPEVVYFMMLYVKKDSDIRQIREQYPDASAINSNEVMRMRLLKLRNECRLLAALMNRLDKAVAIVCVSIAEIFEKDLTRNIDAAGLPLLTSRYYRSLRMGNKETTLALVEKMKEKGGANMQYLEAMAYFNYADSEKLLELTKDYPSDDPNAQKVLVMRAQSMARLGNVDGFITAFKEIDEDVVDTVQFLFMLQELITNAKYSELDNDEFDQSIQELLKKKFKQNGDSPFTPLVSRNFIAYLVEGLPIAKELCELRDQSGEDALPQDKLTRLYQLQMALDLYPNDDISSLIDIDTIKEKGLRNSQEKIGRLAIVLLLEKNKEQTFDNVFAAFSTLYSMGLYKAFVNNVEKNSAALTQYAKAGRKPAVDMIKTAYNIKKQNGEESDALSKALSELGISAES